MAKRKNKNNTLRKGIALLASVVTFIFLFLEMIAIKAKVTVLGKEGVETEGVKFFDVLFKEDYEMLREELSLTTIIMWAVFVLVIISVLLTFLGFVNNKGTKLGSVLLLVAMLLLFVVNVEDPVKLNVLFAQSETSVTNITTLYFVALALSVCGFFASITSKE